MATTTPTEMIREIQLKHEQGLRGTCEFPCHIANDSTASTADVVERVEQVLTMLGIEAAVEFDGALMTVVI